MSNLVRMPTEDELAELSHTKLDDCLLVAFYQWQQAIRMGKHTAENWQIFHAYDNEQLKRLDGFEKYLMELTPQSMH